MSSGTLFPIFSTINLRTFTVPNLFCLFHVVRSPYPSTEVDPLTTSESFLRRKSFSLPIHTPLLLSSRPLRPPSLDTLVLSFPLRPPLAVALPPRLSPAHPSRPSFGPRGSRSLRELSVCLRKHEKGHLDHVLSLCYRTFLRPDVFLNKVSRKDWSRKCKKLQD